MGESLYQQAETLADKLANSQERLVLGESCTAGLACAALGRIPGISRYLCGSAVVYRPATKVAWLDVSPELLENHSAESEPTSETLAQNLLKTTPEATLAGAITGHLGPGAPTEQDGQVYLATARRTPHGKITSICQTVALTTTSRTDRASEAATLLLKSIADQLPIADQNS